MASEIVLLISERRNRQRITLTSDAAPCVFGRGKDCTFSAFVVEAVRMALQDLQDEEE